MIRILGFRDAAGLIQRKALRLEEAERIVAPIIEDVRKRGDRALLEYARKFDGFTGDTVRMLVEGSLTPEIQSAVETAAAKHPRARADATPRGYIHRLSDGRRLGHIVRPLDSMGAYIPAGRYPLPSTLLMTVIPAQVAGVATTCVACPNPSAENSGDCAMARRHALFRMGGAQADRGAGVWNGNGSACGSDCRTWEHLCSGGEEADRGRGWHRLRGRTD